jgi:glycosyltransferase involved in cell wall biosynthesis
MTTQTPSLTVILPSYRRLAQLPDLIAAYRAQGADQIVVVLDGPHPGWQEALGDVDTATHVLELEANRGLALARIAGLRAATGEVILAVDDDVHPEPGLVARHREFHRELGDRVLQGYMPVVLPARRGADDAPSYLYARDYQTQAEGWRRGTSTTILRSLWGGNVSLPRELYLRAEAMKPSQRLEYNEDLDLGIRLLALGAGAVFDESALATHHHSRGIDGYVRECEARGGAVADLEVRWGERPAQLTPLVIIPSSYNRMLARLQRSIASHDTGGAAQTLAILTYRAAGRLRIWRLQDGVARMLRRGLVMRGYRLSTERRDQPALS